jgi:hypothetical protein
MQLTERDRRILEAVHAYDGGLNFSQIQRLFFSSKSQTEERLKLLYQHRYLNRPDKDQRRRLSQMIYWLDKKGAQLIASLNGTPLLVFYWRKELRWLQVEQDLAVIDFRLDLTQACQGDPGASVPDMVSVTVCTHNPTPRGYPKKFVYWPFACMWKAVAMAQLEGS